MITEKMLSAIRSHIFEATFQVMRGAVKLSERAKIEKISFTSKSTLARPSIYDRAYHGKLATASSGNPVGVTKPRLLLLFVQQDKKSLKKSTSLKET